MGSLKTNKLRISECGATQKRIPKTGRGAKCKSLPISQHPNFRPLKPTLEIPFKNFVLVNRILPYDHSLSPFPKKDSKL